MFFGINVITISIMKYINVEKPSKVILKNWELGLSKQDVFLLITNQHLSLDFRRFDSRLLSLEDFGHNFLFFNQKGSYNPTESNHINTLTLRYICYTVTYFSRTQLWHRQPP